MTEPKYKLDVNNFTDHEGTLVLYHKAPQEPPRFRTSLGYSLADKTQSMAFMVAMKPRPRVFTLAWKTEYSLSNGTVSFSWSDNLGYASCESMGNKVDFHEVLVTRSSKEYIPPPNSKEVRLIYDTQRSTARLEEGDMTPLDDGEMQIVMTQNLPPPENNPRLAAGITLEGVPIYVVRTEPGLTCMFRPWIPSVCYLYFTFDKVTEGQVLDLGMVERNALALEYGPYNRHYNVNLMPTNEWEFTRKSS